MGPDAILNTRDYELWAIILTIAGGVCWIILYSLLVRRIIREKYVEMPIIAACGNFAWEFLWGFPFAHMVTLGQAFVWGYRIWFFLDIFIFYHVLKHGHLQIDVPEFKKIWKYLGVLVMLGWAGLIYTFVIDGRDHLWGAPSAFSLAVCISALFIILFIRQRHKRRFSKTLAWLKLLGTGCYSISYLSFQPDATFIRALCILIFVLDAIYLVLLYRNKVHPPADEPIPAT